MTGQLAEPVAPHIRIEIDRDGVKIRQQRPPIASALVGLSVTAALRLVPTLLPVCGQAQSVAARRAVGAAMGELTDGAEDLENTLWREQAFAAAWRNCVDWPDLLGEPRRMDELGAVHRAQDDVSRGTLLADLLPGLNGVHTLGQLLDWVHAGACIGARVAQLALNTGRPLSGIACTSGDELVDKATRALEREPFEPLDPCPYPLDVGPLAMTRDPLMTVLQEELAATIVARVLAQVLDTRVISRALVSGGSSDKQAIHAWSRGQSTGIGRAITCRGPVFHRVVLQADDAHIVQDWRVLAPTDWHFAPRGAVATALPAMVDEAACRLLVTSFDPCVPWSLHCQPQMPAGRGAA